MYKVAFYCDVSGINGKDISDICIGNPGIGGTQYLFLLVSTLLHLNNITKEVIFFCNGKLIFHDVDIPLVEVDSLDECLKICKEKSIDILVVREYEVIRDIKLFDKYNLKIVLWMHNNATSKLKRIASSRDYIRKVLCVSEQQYLNMKKASCFPKCGYINNCFPDDFFGNSYREHDRELVVYIGAVVPQKGVHNLLNIWKYVQDANPNVKLVIIGGASLRNAKEHQGNLGVAKPKYEKLLLSKIKKIRNSKIEFKGVLSWIEIEKILNRAQVGVVNPSKSMRDETFCLSAIEMESRGIPVVSRLRGDGLCTTILDELTGYLMKTDKEIADRIVYLLDNHSARGQMGENAKKHAIQFAASKIIPEWDSMFHELVERPSISCTKSIDVKENIIEFLDKVRIYYYKLMKY